MYTIEILNYLAKNNLTIIIPNLRNLTIVIPNLFISLRIYLTLPVLVASGERTENEAKFEVSPN